jgi:gamma-glutamylputrescine oxidase
VRRERIACDLETTGQLVTAQTSVHAQRLRRQVAAFRDLGFNIPYLDKDALAEVLQSDRYVAALRYPLAATVDPHQLCLGMAERMIAAGVELFEHTPVQQVAAHSPVKLICPAGHVLARHVVLAIDGYAPALGALGRFVVPIDSHVLRTAPVPAALLRSLGWRGREAVIDSRTFFHYYRLTRNDRIVFGGGPVAWRGGNARQEAAASQRIWRRLERELHQVFPALDDLPVTDRWYGTTGSTLDRMPIVGQVEGKPNLWFTGAWCGHGIALSIASGALLAEVLDPSTVSKSVPAQATLPWQRGWAPWLQDGPLRNCGLRAYLLGLDAVDRAGLLIRWVLPRTKRGDR